MFYAISIYIIYRIYELLLWTIDQFGRLLYSMCSVCVFLVQKHTLQDVYATVLWHCQSPAGQILSRYFVAQLRRAIEVADAATLSRKQTKSTGLMTIFLAVV